MRLSSELEADALLLLTDEPAVWSAWPREQGQPIRSASPASLEDLSFDAGSMAPKVEAACDFVARTGKTAGIGALEDAADVAKSKAGTTIYPTGSLRFYPVGADLRNRR